MLDVGGMIKGKSIVGTGKEGRMKAADVLQCADAFC